MLNSWSIDFLNDGFIKKKPDAGKAGTVNLNKNSILGKVLFPSSVIQTRIAELGKIISGDYAGRDLLLVIMLRRSIIFLNDLVRQTGLERS